MPPAIRFPPALLRFYARCCAPTETSARTESPPSPWLQSAPRDLSTREGFAEFAHDQNHRRRRPPKASADPARGSSRFLPNRGCCGFQTPSYPGQKRVERFVDVRLRETVQL